MRAWRRDLRPLTITRHLAVRGEAASDHVFIYRHRPLCLRYCASRLHTYGRRCGIHVMPHQLRHCCAMLLLNAGASILTVQAMLGHRHVDTILDYACLYDGTLAAHYYGAMGEVEGGLESVRSPRAPPTNGGQLLPMVGAPSTETSGERAAGKRS